MDKIKCIFNNLFRLWEISLADYPNEVYTNLISLHKSILCVFSLLILIASISNNILIFSLFSTIEFEGFTASNL